VRYTGRPFYGSTCGVPEIRRLAPHKVIYERPILQAACEGKREAESTDALTIRLDSPFFHPPFDCDPLARADRDQQEINQCWEESAQLDESCIDEMFTILSRRVFKIAIPFRKLPENASIEY
jgi:hypothetical protein